MSNIPTVKIVDKNKDGDYIKINECDFDVNIHALFDDKPKKTKRITKKTLLKEVDKSIKEAK